MYAYGAEQQECQRVSAAQGRSGGGFGAEAPMVGASPGGDGLPDELSWLEQNGFITNPDMYAGRSYVFIWTAFKWELTGICISG